AAVVGRLLSEDQVLLRTDREMETIMRLPKQADLKVGDRLIALPAFRPLISAASNTMEVDGGTSLEITGLDEKQVPEISLHYGRVLIRALPFPDSRLRVRIGDSVGTLVYEQADSVVGIEVRPYRSPGTDPEQVASMHAVDLYVVSGKIRWISGDQEEVIEAPARKQLSAHRDDKETAFDEQPAWLARSTITALDRRGISTIQQRLQHDSSVSLSLSELAEPKQRFEVRRLALRGCAYVAYFDPLIDALADKEEFNRWFTIFLPELTSAIARDPQTAAKLRRTLERKRGDDAEDLYRMLWGYSRDDLIGAEDPQASKLVDYLDHEDLDYRVLSIWNLRQITGLGLNYRPEDDESDRRKSVVRWRKKANSGEIVPRGTEPGPAAAEK
ncbi:MAG TPA: hypothetical protein VMX74_01230, partial [Pirellulales bacterium]|nr:hypothetical protein [Pirellulales bacterium]